MDVVVNVLASNNGHDGAGALALDADHLILVLGSFLGEARLDAVGVIVLKGAVLDGDDVVVVSLLQGLAVIDWLDGGVIVVLVDFLVDGRLDVLMLGLGDGLSGDRRNDLLVNGGIMMARLGPGRVDVSVRCLLSCEGGTHMKSLTAALAASMVEVG